MQKNLKVHKCGERKIALGIGSPMAISQGVSQHWGFDFVSAELIDGRCFRLFNMIDDFNRQFLTTIADYSLSGENIVYEINQLFKYYGQHDMIVSYNSAEITSNTMLEVQQLFI